MGELKKVHHRKTLNILKTASFEDDILITRAHFRKTRHACSKKKEHILVNLGQFKNETPLNSVQI